MSQLLESATSVGGGALVTTVVRMLLHQGAVQSGRCPLPQKMASVFGTELADQTKFVNLSRAAVSQRFDGRGAVGSAGTGFAIVGSAKLDSTAVGSEIFGSTKGLAVMGCAMNGWSMVGSAIFGFAVEHQKLSR